MPPKGKKPALDIIPSESVGKTQKQIEEEELRKMQEMAVQMFSETHKGPKGGKSGKKAAAQRLKADETLAKRRADAEREFEAAHTRMMEAAVYENQFVELSTGLEWFNVGGDKWVRYEQFKPEYLATVVQLLTESLSEPYNAFTYKYFLEGWPDLAIVAFGVTSADAPSADTKGDLIGVVISKVSRKAPTKPLRGYIAMLAVAKSFRGNKLGQRLVKLSVELMKQKKVEEVCLETPTSNERALNLYLTLGFVKHKFLARYYLDGQDAVRLKLWLSSPYEQPNMSENLQKALMQFQNAMGRVQQLDGPAAAGVAAAAAE